MAGPGPVDSRKVVVPPTSRQAGESGNAKEPAQPSLSGRNLTLTIDETEVRKQIADAMKTFGPEQWNGGGGRTRNVSNAKTEDIALDRSGPMTHGTEAYRPGQSLQKSIANAWVAKIVDAKTMFAQVRDPAGDGNYHIKVTVDPKDGTLRRMLDLQPGDQLNDKQAGGLVSIGAMIGKDRYQAIRQDNQGRQQKVTVDVVNNGGDWRWHP